MRPPEETTVELLYTLAATTAFLVGVPTMIGLAAHIERRLDEPAR